MATELIWAQLVHLSDNMWHDREACDSTGYEYTTASTRMRFHRPTWDDLIARFVESGVNTVLVDLGDAVRYESHPEIAVEDAWTPAQLKEELARLRDMGLKALPKLNFAASHDAWLGEYARMLSTRKYYEVAADLIAETCELFDGPGLFHLGMDEETHDNQNNGLIAIIRQHELWWHDLLFMVEQVEKAGSRAWIWADKFWHHPDEFIAQMPRSVMMSNWYYGGRFNSQREGAQAYIDLDTHGFDQIPTGSNWDDADNLRKTVKWCKENVDHKRLFGFLQTVWKPVIARRKTRLFEAADEVGVARMEWDGTWSEEAFEVKSGG